jgi:hypothetical protein
MHEFKEGGPAVLEEWNKRARESRWGIVPRTGEPLLQAGKIRHLEEAFIPESLQRDYDETFGHNRH